MLSEKVTEVTDFSGKPVIARANVLPESAVTRVTSVTAEHSGTGTNLLWPALRFQCAVNDSNVLETRSTGYWGSTWDFQSGPFPRYVKKTISAQNEFANDYVCSSHNCSEFTSIRNEQAGVPS